MKEKNVLVEVFGAEVLCASCVNAPSSKGTYEWLEAAIPRKFPEQPFDIVYIDIEDEMKDERHQKIAQQIAEDEYFYPLVMVNQEMVGEGHIQLKPIFKALENQGFIA